MTRAAAGFPDGVARARRQGSRFRMLVPGGRHDRKEYEERRRALEEQLRADIALLNAAHEARIRALDRLRQEAPDSELPAADAPPPAPKPMRPRYSVMNDLEDALPKLPQIFKRQDILRALGYEPPRTTLFRALNRLQEEGAITVDNHSPGGTAVCYRKLS